MEYDKRCLNAFDRLKTMHAHCELPSVVSPRIGAAQEVVHISLGYEQSKLISSHSTLASIQHYRRAADRSAWRKQAYSLTGAPFDDDDDDDDVAVGLHNI